MSDRYNSLTVALEHDIKDEDAKQIIDAIKCFRNVLSVTPKIVSHSDYVAEERARSYFIDRINEALQEQKTE
ncbi:MAG: hypothetical protein FWB73_00305 [Treponema sp.]|nr:hypothetical protein [Treponema sp.]